MRPRSPGNRRACIQETGRGSVARVEAEIKLLSKALGRRQQDGTPFVLESIKASEKAVERKLAERQSAVQLLGEAKEAHGARAAVTQGTLRRPSTRVTPLPLRIAACTIHGAFDGLVCLNAAGTGEEEQSAAWACCNVAEANLAEATARREEAQAEAQRLRAEVDVVAAEVVRCEKIHTSMLQRGVLHGKNVNNA